MDKYTLLMVLNIPFVLWGMLKLYIRHKKGAVSSVGFVLRFMFWLLLAAGLVFAEEIYTFLYTRGLTASDPLSIADVVLATGLFLSLSLGLRLYTKLEAAERRFNTLQEKLAIEFLEDKQG